MAVDADHGLITGANGKSRGIVGLTLFLQYVVSGLGFGGIYALGAISLALIFNTSTVVNFASASLAALCAYLLWTLLHLSGMPMLLAWLGGVLGSLLVGLTVESAFMRRVEKSSGIVRVVMTLGLLIAVEGLVGAVWGYSPKSLPSIVSGRSFKIGSVLFDRGNALIVILTLVIALLLLFVYRKTRFGLAMLAVASDRETASLMGINAGRYISISWAAGTLLVGLSAALAAPSTGLSPDYMSNIAVFAFAAAVLGGFGSLSGAIAGGMIIGIFSNLVSGYVSNNLQLTFVFLLIVALLYVRPEGLLGAKTMVRQ